MREFFEDDCEFAAHAFVPVAELRAAYDEWAKANGVRFTLGSKQFNRRLRARGCEQRTKKYENDLGTEVATRCWQGVTLRAKPRYDTVTEEVEIREEIPF